MAAAYSENNINATASFELFVRTLPPERTYLLLAGLEQALQHGTAIITGAALLNALELVMGPRFSVWDTYDLNVMNILA
jgi:nicotinate phosphoribosyltransferase